MAAIPMVSLVGAVVFSARTCRPLRRLAAARLVAALVVALACGPALAKTAVILNSDDDSLSVIDTETYKETSRVHIGRQPHHLMLTPDKQHLILAMSGSNELVFLDLSTGMVKQRLIASDPYQIGFTDLAGRIAKLPP